MHVSLWTLVFALPYLVYALYSIYSCFKRFDVVYIGSKSFDSRIFGFINAIILLIFALFNPLILAGVNRVLFLEPIRIYFDLLLLIFSLIGLITAIVYGVILRERALPRLNADYIARQRQRARQLSNTPVTTSRSRPRTSSRRTTSQSSSRDSRRTTPTGTVRSSSRSSSSRTTTSRSSSRQKSRPASRTPSKKYSLKALRPKAGALSKDDFRCIFCFQYPNLERDRSRGIILCPICKFPAHADEFLDWHKSTNLCSRCDSAIPQSFLRNPEIIPVSVYLKAMKALRKEFR